MKLEEKNELIFEALLYVANRAGCTPMEICGANRLKAIKSDTKSLRQKSEEHVRTLRIPRWEAGRLLRHIGAAVSQKGAAMLLGLSHSTLSLTDKQLCLSGEWGTRLSTIMIGFDAWQRERHSNHKCTESAQVEIDTDPVRCRI